MNQPPEQPNELRQLRHKEFQDNHYHDEDDQPLAPDDASRPGNVPRRGKATPRLPTKRHYEE